MKSIRHEERTGKKLIFPIVLSIPVIVAAVFLFNAKRNFDLRKKVEQEKQLFQEARTEKEQQLKRDSENKIRELWNKTVRDANDLAANEEFARALSKMEELKELIKEPAFVRKTETCIRNITKLRALAVQKLINKLTDEANTYIAEGNIRKAVVIYENYSGRLADETKEQRAKFVLKLSEYQNTQVKN